MLLENVFGQLFFEDSMLSAISAFAFCFCFLLKSMMLKKANSIVNMVNMS